MNKLYIFASNEGWLFPVLQSNLHEAWTRKYSATLKTDIQYSPTDCFENFPFPDKTVRLEKIGDGYHSYRQSVMLTQREGLTKTYNRFHDPDKRANDIAQLRELHVEMDQAVLASYGWEDLDLGHGFHETILGPRFTISELARYEVLDRLLLLNHARYAEEVKQGLHDTGKKGGIKKFPAKNAASNSGAAKKVVAKTTVPLKPAGEQKSMF